MHKKEYADLGVKTDKFIKLEDKIATENADVYNL